MSKGGKSQTVTQKLDPETQRMQREVFDRAREVSQQPYTPYGHQTVATVDPNTTQALDRFQRGANLGFGGLDALAGDPNAIARLMNPYHSQVVGALGQHYDRMRNQAALGANDDATRAGAFGGDRHALLVGERQGALDRQQGADTANLLYGGYNDAMGRAGQLANLGFGASDRLFQGGDYLRNVDQQGLDDRYRRHLEERDWGVRGLDILKSGMAGTPYGMSTNTPLHRNWGAGVLGGAATGAQIGSLVPGIGTAVGAGLGGLFGLL